MNRLREQQNQQEVPPLLRSRPKAGVELLRKLELLIASCFRISSAFKPSAVSAAAAAALDVCTSSAFLSKASSLSSLRACCIQNHT